MLIPVLWIEAFLTDCVLLCEVGMSIKGHSRGWWVLIESGSLWMGYKRQPQLVWVPFPGRPVQYDDFECFYLWQTKLENIPNAACIEHMWTDRMFVSGSFSGTIAFWFAFAVSCCTNQWRETDMTLLCSTEQECLDQTPLQDSAFAQYLQMCQSQHLRYSIASLVCPRYPVTAQIDLWQLKTACFPAIQVLERVFHDLVQAQSSFTGITLGLVFLDPLSHRPSTLLWCRGIKRQRLKRGISSNMKSVARKKQAEALIEKGSD